MRFNRLDLNLLVALDALLTERSISRAAERVHLSQSTLSHMLGRLREHFKDELLVQVGRRMELTPRAESLRDPIRDVLVRINTTIDIEPHFDPSQTDREFTLHVSDYTMEMLVPHMLALARQQRSTARFKLLPQVGSPFRALERGEVDMLLIPQAWCSPDHPTEPLFEEDFVCVLWSGSPLAQGELTMERYLQAHHAVMEPAGSGQPAYEGWIAQRYGVSRKIEVTSYSFTVLPAMVVGTDLVATVHARLARRAVQSLPLKRVPSPLAMPALAQALQWHKHRTADPGLAWVRGLLHEAALRMDAAEGSILAKAPPSPTIA